MKLLVKHDELYYSQSEVSGNEDPCDTCDLDIPCTTQANSNKNPEFSVTCDLLDHDGKFFNFKVER